MNSEVPTPTNKAEPPSECFQLVSKLNIHYDMAGEAWFKLTLLSPTPFKAGCVVQKKLRHAWTEPGAT